MVRVKFSFTKEPEDYSKKKKEIILPKLIQVYWDITYRCPLRCDHCYAKLERAVDNELTTDEAKRTIDILKEHDISLITFSGGEPLARNDIFELVSYASSGGINVSLITSGSFPHRMNDAKLSGVSRVQISLDSSDPYINDRIRGVRGSYDRSMSTISNSIHNGIRTSVCATVRKENYEQIPDVFELARDMNADEFRLMRLMPCGLSNKTYREKSITRQQYSDLLNRLVNEYMKNHPILVDIEDPFPFAKQFKGTPAETYIFYRGCLQGEAICSITADGKITPCPIANYTEFIAGDVRTDDILYVWENSPVFDYFRSVENIGTCSGCEESAVCGGGCRCAAFGYFGRIDAPDPMCPYTPGVDQ